MELSKPSISVRSWFRVCSSLVVASSKARSVTLLTDRIDLVDKHDTGEPSHWRLLEKVTDLGRSHTYEHFHKFRTGNGEEGYLRLSGNRFRQKCLTCSGRSYKKGAFGAWMRRSRNISADCGDNPRSPVRSSFASSSPAYIRKLDACGRLHIYFGVCSCRKTSFTPGASAHGAHHLLAEPASQKDKDSYGDHITEE